MKESTVNRREFLKGTAAAAAVTLTSGVATDVLGKTNALPADSKNKYPGRVVVNFNKNAVTMNGNASTAVPDVIKSMVDDAILCLTGKGKIGDAWKDIFPSTLNAQSKIAIKVPLGCATQKMAPHWAAVKAITDGLQQMDFNGTKLPAANITIYDMRCSNNIQRYGYTSANFGSVKCIYDSMGSGYTDGANNKQYAKSLHDADFLINVFRPGGHSGYVEGLTLGFKNHYGTYDVDHGSGSAPGYLRDINCTGAVLKKNVLSVCHGIFGAQENSGNPGSSDVPYFTYAKGIDSTITNSSYPPCTIIMSTDPVTTEMQCIKMMRINQGKTYDPNAMPKYLKSSGGISGGPTPVYNVGVIDESQMDIRRIINGKVISTAAKNNQVLLTPINSGIHVTQLHGAHSTFIEYFLPESYTGKDASIEIYNLNGILVFKTLQRVCGVKNHFSWDENDGNGRAVASGTYLVNLVSGKTKVSTNLSIIR